MYAGLKRASGNYIVVMYVDLQDPTDLLPEMLISVDSGERDAVTGSTSWSFWKLITYSI
nr:glycosyltransferase [Weissella cibaria]